MNFRWPLTHRIGPLTSLTVWLVGPSGAGKTSWLAALLREFARAGNQNAEGPLRYDPPLQQQPVFQDAQQAVSQGRAPAATLDLQPSPVRAILKHPRGRSLAFRAYDSSGKVFEGPDIVGAARTALHDCNAIWLLIDAQSLPKNRRATSTLPSGDSIREAPQAICDRLINALRQSRPVWGKDVALAVILVKTDVQGLEEQIRQADPGFATGRSLAAGEVESRSVRGWLVGNAEGNLVESLENEFRNVCYFSGSALGKSSAGEPAAPESRGMLEPLDWTLGRQRALRRQKVRRKLLVLAGTALLLAGGYYGSRGWLHRWWNQPPLTGAPPTAASPAPRPEDFPPRGNAEMPRIVSTPTPIAAQPAIRSLPSATNLDQPVTAQASRRLAETQSEVREFVARHMQAVLGGDAFEFRRAIEQNYAPLVFYQWSKSRDRNASRQEILADKIAYRQGWPIRNYDLSSVTVVEGSLLGSAADFTVAVTWQWDCSNPALRAMTGGMLRSAGVARDTLGIKKSGNGYLIVSEEQRIERWILKPVKASPR